jgi:hypothetical protein
MQHFILAVLSIRHKSEQNIPKYLALSEIMPNFATSLPDKDV